MFRLCGHLLRKKSQPLIAIGIKRNGNFLQSNAESLTKCLSKHNASSLAGPGAPSMKNEEKVTPMGWFMLVIYFICTKETFEDIPQKKSVLLRNVSLNNNFLLNFFNLSLYQLQHLG